MKRKFMGLLVLAVGVLTLVSCKKDEEERQMVFSASMEQGGQKTALDSDEETINWSEGDKISLFATGASTPSNAEFTAHDGGTTVTDFTGTISGSGPYVAVYPYNAGISYDKTGILKGVVIPTTQVATPNGFDPKANVMMAQSGNTSLEFKNVCAYIKFTTNAPYKSIKIISNNSSDKLSGTFDVEWNNGTPLATATTGKNYVFLQPASEYSTIAAGTYVIAVAPAVLSSGFIIEFVSATNEVKGKTKSASVTFKRSVLADYGTIREASLTTTHEYVDLGLSVLWAKCNIGAASETDYGDYFAWGEVEPYYSSLSWSSATNKTVSWKTDKPNGYDWSSYKYCSGSSNTLTKYYAGDALTILEAGDDVATQKWGGSWRMPTQTEMQKLIDSCTWAWQTNYNEVGCGWLITSKMTGYTDKRIFLRASGSVGGTSFWNQNCYGGYWTSSLNTNTNDPSLAWHLSFSSSGKEVSRFTRVQGLSVRPVRSK